MNTAPVVLLTEPRLTALQTTLEAQGWRVANLWAPEGYDRQSVTAILNVGEGGLIRDFRSTLSALRLIANVGVGYDGVDLGWCRANGVDVTHAKGLNADDVADHAIGLLLGSWRDIAAGDQVIRAGLWSAGVQPRPPRSLAGCKLGVVGLGAIGTATAKRAEVFGLDVSWWGPRRKEGTARPRAETLLELATACDILVITCRYDVSTHGLVSAKLLSALGPRGLLVNVSRGAVIDEDALISALRQGHFGRAALDVFIEEPTPPERWVNVPNTLLTPHLAGATSGSIPRLLNQALENLRRFLAAEPLLSPV